MTLRTVATFLVLVLASSPTVTAKSNDSKRKPKNKKQDVEAIGDRDVGKGVNFYSIEKAGINALKNLAKKMDLDLCK